MAREHDSNPSRLVPQERMDMINDVLSDPLLYSEEFKYWLAKFLKTHRISHPRIDSTENVGTTNGVQSIEPDADFETEGFVLTADGVGGSLWAEGAASTPATYSELVLTQGTHITSYWKMDAASGSQPDYSANPAGLKPLAYTTGVHAGVYDVTGALIAPQDDGAFQFNYNQDISDGNQGGIVRGSIFTSDDTGDRWAFSGIVPFSVSLWVKPTAGSLQIAAAGLVSCIDNVSGTFGFEGWSVNWTGTQVRFARSSGPSGNQVAATLTAGVWTYVVGTYDGVTIRLYVNGALSTSIADTTALPTHTGISVGGYDVGVADSRCYFYGSLDEIAVFDLCLTAVEVSELYAAGVGTLGSITSPAGAVAGDVPTADGVGGSVWAPPTIELTF